MITEKNVGDYASMVAQMKEITKAPVIAQLTHSGRFSKNSMTPHPLFATRSLPFESVRPGDRDVPVVTDEYLDTLPEAYARAAILAEKAGFDGVDIKACHGYLLSELLSAHTREGKYGGSFENRTRLLLDIIDAVRAVPASGNDSRFEAFCFRYDRLSLWLRRDRNRPGSPWTLPKQKSLSASSWKKI